MFAEVYGRRYRVICSAYSGLPGVHSFARRRASNSVVPRYGSDEVMDNGLQAVIARLLAAQKRS